MNLSQNKINFAKIESTSDLNKLSKKYSNRSFLTDDYGQSVLVYHNNTDIEFKKHLIKFKFSKLSQINKEPKIVGNKKATEIVEMFNKKNLKVTIVPTYMLCSTKFLKFYSHRNIEYIAVKKEEYLKFGKNKKYKKSKLIS